MATEQKEDVERAMQLLDEIVQANPDNVPAILVST
jgi:hypothetical protein